MQSQITQLVYRLQPLKINQVEYLMFINCYGKANRETHVLAQRHMIGNRLFVRKANRKPFLSARRNIWNSNGAFYNKTNCLLRRGCFNRYLSVVTPVNWSCNLSKMEIYLNNLSNSARNIKTCTHLFKVLCYL